MKKKCDFLPPRGQRWKFNFSLRMRLLVTLLLVGALHVSANSVAQTKVSLTMKNAAVEEVFQRLESMTGYTFLYNLDLLKGCGRVDVDARDEDFSQLLAGVLKPFGLSFKLDDRVVVIMRDDEKKEPKELVIKGRVIMKDSTTVPGATVVVKGTSAGVITNMDGTFTIAVPKQDENPVLVFSFVGLKKKEVKYEGKDMVVVMEEETQEVDEVVVTGYQRIRKSDMVGSTNTVKREDLFYNGTNSIEQMLQGKLPGVLVMNTSGLVGVRQKVRVRGTSTLLGNQEPVWVVDGIIQEDPLPFKAQELDNYGVIEDNFDMVRNFVGNAISWLNPNDIESITVLKDASATVMYGVKAANGVILITTKKGEKGRMAVNYSGNFSLTPKLTYKKMNLMNSKERIDVSREIYQRGLTGTRALESVGYEGVLARYLAKEISYDEFDAEVKRLEAMNTDWFDILFRNSFSMNHSVGISGGTDKITYYGSVNATSNKGNSPGNETEQYSASIRLSASFNKVDLNLSINGSTSETKGYYQVDPYGYATSTSRAIPCFTETGDRFFYKKDNGYLYNILHEIDMTGNKNTNRSMSVSASLRWDVVKGLQFESTFGFNTSNVFGESWADEQSAYITAIREYEFGTQRPADELYQESQLPHGGELNTTEDRNFSYTWRNQLSYNYILKEKHRFSLMVGQELRSAKYDGVSSTLYGYFPGRGKTVTLPPKIIKRNGEDVANDILDRYSTVVTDRKSNYMSYYASFSYGFGERYILTGSFRSDASNRFGQDTRHRFLPVWSIGGRWNVHYEPWMQNQEIISDLNIRATYGWQGNVAENYGPDLIASTSAGIDQGRTGEYMLSIVSLPYGDLRWEKTKTINLGADFGLFKNRLYWSVEYYWKKTEDMIVEKEVPYAYGVTSMPINGGNMSNHGLEISLSFTPLRLKNFVWNMSVNTSKNFNKVESTMAENESWMAAASGSLNKEGYPVTSFWAFEFAGLDPENGSALFELPTLEERPEAITDATAFMKYMGTTEPDFQGGVSMSFSYKTLSLSTSFNLQLGGKKFLYHIFDETTFGIGNSTPSAYANLPKEMVKRWKQPGDEKITNIPAIPSKESLYYDLPNGWTDYSARMYNYSDARVVNASFFRCNSLSLSYTLPEKIVNKMHLKNLSFNASISNPFIIVSKDFKGMDPEVASGSQPISRTVSLGINISL